MTSVSRLLHVIAAATSLGLLVAPTSAQLYTKLGPGQVLDVSADGTTVLGNGGGAYLWTKTGGQVPIGGGNAFHLSGDGTTIVGDVIDPGSGTVAAGVWTASTGWTSLGSLPTQSPPTDLSSGYDVSFDGSVAVGLGWTTTFKARGFRWDATNGMTELPQLGPNSSRASAISADGTTIGGFDEAPSGQRRGKLWFDDGSQLLCLVTAANPDGVGEVNWINSDGTIAVGQSLSQPFRWTASGGVELLPKPPGAVAGQSYWALAASDDGSTVVGGGGSFFAGGLVAWIWTEAGGTQRLDDILTANGVTGLAINELENATSCSTDGTIIVGWGKFPLSEGWVVDLDAIAEWNDLGNGLAGTSGVPVLQGLGTQQAGALTRLRLTNAKPSTTTALVIGASALHAPFKGGVFVPNADLVLAGLPVNATGQLLISFAWPAGLPSDTMLWYQHWVTDAAGPLGFAASNGLQSVSP